MTDKSASLGRRLDRLAEIVALDTNLDRPWWRILVPASSRTFSLVQDDRETARIRTALERDDGFGWGVSCRRTDVSFEDGEWTIRTHSPSDPRHKTKFRWFSTAASWLKLERIVEVTDGSGQIAHLAHPADGQPLTAKTVGGTSLSLTRQSRHLLEAEVLTIKRTKRTYEMTATSPVPLEAALLYWHLMLGDYQRPLEIA
jgi:hypothetical protein